MELLDILQAFKGGKDVEYRGLKGQVWQRVCGFHKWNTEKFEYRVKPEYEVYPYTKEELFESIAMHGSLVRKWNDTTVSFYIADVLSDRILLRRNRRGTEKCVSYQDFADMYVWRDNSSPCGWSSALYEIVEEPVYDKGVQMGVERLVKRKES